MAWLRASSREMMRCSSVQCRAIVQTLFQSKPGLTQRAMSLGPGKILVINLVLSF